MARCYIISVSD